MIEHVPSVWTFVLLTAAAYRSWRLLAEDDILDRPRRWLLNLGSWQDGQAAPIGYRATLGEFITCPFCFGAWIGIAWWVAWLITDWTVVVAVPFAISAAIALLNAMVGWLTAD